MYLIFKHSHLMLVLLSVCFLVIRVIGVSVNAQWVNKKLIKVAPHIIDTILLASAIGLMVILSQYPVVNAWLSAKVVALVAYVALGTMALKGQKSALQRFGFLALALLCIGYMASVALSKNPMPWG